MALREEVLAANRRCRFCGGFMILEREFEGDELVCLSCGMRVTLPKPTGAIVEEIRRVQEDSVDALKPVKRIKGISEKESRRIWRKSPEGKKAVFRYQHSQLFREAHARHRKTDKYRQSQEKYKSKIELFKVLSGDTKAKAVSTCPRNLFHSQPGMPSANDMALCDLISGNCTMACVAGVIEKLKARVAILIKQ